MRNSSQTNASFNVVANPARPAQQPGDERSHLRRLNIGPRLTLCFASIILAMLVGNAILLWQFHRVRAQAEHVRGVDEQLIAVLQAHTSLMSFYERLDVLAQSEDSAALVRETESLREALIEDTRRTTSVFTQLPPEVQPDPTLLATLDSVQDALPPQLDAIAALARSRDWEAVRLRLANKVRPLESRTATLVQNLDGEVSQERTQALLSIGRAQRRVLLAVPITVALTLVIAALLGLAIRRSITQPLGQLMEGSEALARGEFQHQVSVVGNDELAHLGRTFNHTSGRLHDLYEALQSREAYLAEAQRLSQTGSFGWNASTGKVSWSDETFRIFESDPATLIPSIESVLRRVHPADVDRVRQEFDRAARDGSGLDLEHRLLMPDGSVKYVRAVAHPATDSAGQPEFVGAVMDVTASKQAEEALRQAQAALAHVTRVTTLGEMTTTIAHEVNQPLAAAITNSNTCLRWLARDPPNLEEAREAASRTVKDATRAAEIIRRIRVFFKKGAPQLEPVDINEAIREMTVLLRDDAERYSVSIRTDLAEDLPYVMADRVQLQQVFMNLMLNGIEAIKKMSAAGEVTVRSQSVDGAHLQISVSDTGVGLAPQPDQIFDAFYTTKPDGIGMGLPISRSIIESHGGRLWAAANAGPGATFRFTLPGEVEGSE
jgi:signal transduction histidine kinase/HAMP domain-containing protein